MKRSTASIRPGGILRWSTACILAGAGLSSCDRGYVATAKDQQMAEAQQRIDTARNGVMNAFRVVNGLGVISGPDMDIINSAIGDPTSIGTRIRGRGTVAQIEAAVGQMQKQNAAVRQILAKAFGLDTLSPQAGAGTRLPNNPQDYD